MKKSLPKCANEINNILEKFNNKLALINQIIDKNLENDVPSKTQNGGFDNIIKDYINYKKKYIKFFV